MEICLDTCILIDILRGDNTVIEKLKKYRFKPVITIVNAFELYMGEKKEEKLDSFVRKFKIYPLDLPSVKIAGRIYKILKKRGKMIDFRDLLIGAICIRFGLPLITKNVKHFEKLKEFGLTLLSLS